MTRGYMAVVACGLTDRPGDGFLAPVLEEPPGFPEHPGPGDAACLTYPAVGQVEDRLQVDLDGGQHQGQASPDSTDQPGEVRLGRRRWGYRYGRNGRDPRGMRRESARDG